MKLQGFSGAMLVAWQNAGTIPLEAYILGGKKALAQVLTKESGQTFKSNCRESDVSTNV